MKVRRTLSGILFGLGCALTFIGLLALILPAVANDQLHLVLASFDAPSDNPIVRLMNSGMSYALHHGWQVLFAGAAMLVVGLILFTLFSREKKSPPRQEPYRRPAPVQPEPIWEQPVSASVRPNPFADMALWDQQFAPAKKQAPAAENPFSAYGGPMLERNRVEDAPTYSFSPEAYVRPVEPEQMPEPECEPVKADIAPAPAIEIPAAPQPLTPPALSSVSAPLMRAPQPPATVEKPEPVYTPNEEPDAPVQISSRIRSTMGRHREW